MLGVHLLYGTNNEMLGVHLVITCGPTLLKVKTPSLVLTSKLLSVVTRNGKTFVHHTPK